MTLPKNRKIEIKEKANQVLLESFDGAPIIPPVNLNTILERNNLTLKKGSFANEAISGAYNRTESTIYVAENDKYFRQAFTVAHELGHFFLHKGLSTEVFLRSSDFDSAVNNTEAEANEFAADLLMPQELVERFWIIGNDVAKMANVFGVSFSAMNWRLRNLGLKHE